VVICVERGADLHMAPLSLALVKSRLVFTFLVYQPTRVVPEKGPLNGCVCYHMYGLIVDMSVLVYFYLCACCDVCIYAFVSFVVLLTAASLVK